VIESVPKFLYKFSKRIGERREQEIIHFYHYLKKSLQMLVTITLLLVELLKHFFVFP